MGTQVGQLGNKNFVANQPIVRHRQSMRETEGRKSMLTAQQVAAILQISVR